MTLGLLPALKPSFNEPDLSDKPIWRPQLEAEDLLGVDGRSLVPLLRGQAPLDWRQRFLVEHWWTDSVFEIPSFAALRTGASDSQAARTLYVEYYDQNYAQAEDEVADPVMCRELYDLAADPFQLDSLHREAGRGPQIDALSHLLAGLRTCGAAAGQTACRELEK